LIQTFVRKNKNILDILISLLKFHFKGSSLGVFDGNVYENLFKFAQNSKFNDKEVHDAFHKYLKPYSQRYKLRARL